MVDAHTHTFPESIAAAAVSQLEKKACSRAYTAGTDEALCRSMRQAGIDRSILLPVMTNVKQVVKLNDIALQKNENTPATGLFSLGGMHPDFEGYAAELARIAARGITGIKLHPAYQGMDLNDVRYLRIIEKAAELGLAVVVHAGLDIGIMHHNFASVSHIQSVLREIAPPKLVLAHMGGWKDWDTVERELCGENVYFDTSFSIGSYVPPAGTDVPAEKRLMLDIAQFERMVNKHGAHRILFGSDSPWSDQAQSYAQIKACRLSDEAKIKIFDTNAEKLFFGK